MNSEDEIRRALEEQRRRIAEEEFQRALEGGFGGRIRNSFPRPGGYYPPRRPASPTANNPEADGKKPPKEDKK